LNRADFKRWLAKHGRREYERYRKAYSEAPCRFQHLFRIDDGDETAPGLLPTEVKDDDKGHA